MLSAISGRFHLPQTSINGVMPIGLWCSVHPTSRNGKRLTRSSRDQDLMASKKNKDFTKTPRNRTPTDICGNPFWERLWEIWTDENDFKKMMKHNYTMTLVNVKNTMVWLLAYCFPMLQRLDDWKIHWLQLEQVTSKQVWTRSSARETSNLAAKQGTMDVDEPWLRKNCA